MRISAINSSQTFTSEESSKQKTNTFKNIGIGVGSGIVAEKIISKGGLRNIFANARKEFAEVLAQEVSKSSSEVTLKDLYTPKLRKMAHWNLIGNMATILAAGFVSGYILDWFINIPKQEKAQKALY